MIDIPCVIFAGGKSSRMGEDKALLPFASYKTLTQYQYDRLSKIFSKVYISCKTRDKFDFSANFIEDKSLVFAPTTGFVTMFNEIDASRYFVISVDAPFIDEIEIEKLLKSDDDRFDVTIAKTQNGLEPLCGIYHISMKEGFENMLKDDNHRLKYLLKNSKLNVVYFEDLDKFSNLNYIDDYKKALKSL